MNRGDQSYLTLPESFLRFNTRNRENLLQARLEIRTSADIYKAFQSNFRRATAEGSSTLRGSSEGTLAGGLKSRILTNASKTSRAVRGSTLRQTPVADQNQRAIKDQYRDAAGRQLPEGPRIPQSLKTVSRY